MANDRDRATWVFPDDVAKSAAERSDSQPAKNRNPEGYDAKIAVTVRFDVDVRICISNEAPQPLLPSPNVRISWTVIRIGRLADIIADPKNSSQHGSIYPLPRQNQATLMSELVGHP